MKRRFPTRAAAVLILTATAGVGCNSAEHAASELAITHATVVDIERGRLLENRTVVIAGGRITTVAPTDAVVLPPTVRIVDGQGGYLIPGLADMHVHFSLGAPLARRPDETDQVLARFLFYGVTSVLALGGTDLGTDMVNGLRERHAAGDLRSPWIYAAGGHLTLPGAHPIATIFPPDVRAAADRILATTPPEEPADLYELGIGISLVRTDDAARSAVLERAVGGMDAIKITVESGPGPFGTDHPKMPRSMIRAIVDEASLHGLRVFAHASSPEELADVLDEGAAGVLHAIGDAPLPDEAVADRMRAAGFYYVPTLVLYENFIRYWNDPSEFEDSFLRATVSTDEIASFEDPGFVQRHRTTFDYFDGPIDPPPSVESTKRTEALRANVGFLHERGVSMVVGTDTGNPFTFPGYSVHQELELLVQAGLTPREALLAGTLRAAEMLGKEREFGTIAEGLRADLVLLEANPLEDIRNVRLIRDVFANGQHFDRSALDVLVEGGGG